MHREISRRLIVLALLTAAPIAAAFGQVTSGTIAGTVADQSGGALPGVTVTVKEVDTGVTRMLVTDGQGRYRALALEPGTYEVLADLTGFQRSVRGGLRLTIGQEVVVNVVLALGQLEEQIVVTEAAPLVETTRSAVAHLVDENQIRQLPLNGRDFSELALSGIGVVQTPTVDRSLLRGMGTQFSVAGARPNMVSYLLDGTDIADQGGQSPGSAAGGLLGIETIREFQVITNNYSAEYGRSAGGIVSAVTRSGTNTLRGSTFEFHRNDAFDARTFFDPADEPIPPLTRNQYGFTLGGPLRKDRTFFFGSFEGLRQDKGKTLVSRVPSRATRNRPDLHPATRPYLLMYPEPNGPESGASGLYSVAINEPTREDYFVVKIDHTLSAKDSGSIRYTFDDASVVEPISHGLFSNEHKNRNQYVTLEWKRLFSGSLLNDFRAAFNRTFQRTFNVDNISVDPSLFFFPGGSQFGAISVTGLEGIGTDTSVPFLLGYNVLQVINNLTWTKGRHTVKTGGIWTRWYNNQNASFQVGGSYMFASIDEFVRGIANNFESALPGTSSDRYWRQNLFGFYAQDDWAVLSRVTLNLGLRYEFITTPKEKYDRVASFRNPLDPAPTVGYPLFRNPSLKNFAPRIGFAWDVTGDGKTAVRGGGGMFYEPILANIYRTFGNRTPPFFAQASLRSPPFPRAVGAAPPTSQQRLDLLQFDLENPYMVQYNLTVQRELLPQLLVMAGFIGSRGIHMMRNVEANQSVPQVLSDGRYFFPTNRRRSSNWASVRVRRTDGNSWYKGLVAGVTKRFSAGLQLQASYTFGKSFDEGSISAGSQDFGNGFQPRYADDRHDNYGLSDFDARHNFNFTYTYTLPFGESTTGAAKALAAGWQLSGVVSLRAGVPFTPLLSFDQARAAPRSGGAGQRPNLVPGSSTNPVLGGPQRYFDPNAFTLPEPGFFGNLQRNTIIGPGYATWNAAVFKNFELGGRRRLQVRIEGFNVLNRANFALPAATVFGRPTAANPTGRVENAGEITDIVGTARQIQLGVRLEF